MVSQGERESAGRSRLQKTRFQHWGQCGWQRAGRWLLLAAGGCWHHLHGPWESPLQSRWQKKREGEIHLHERVCKVCLEATQSKMIFKKNKVLLKPWPTLQPCLWLGFCFPCWTLCIQSRETAFHDPDQSHTHTLVWTFPGPLSTLLPLKNNGPLPSLKEATH